MSATFKNCDGLTRRSWIRAGGLSALGLSMPQLFGLQQSSDASEKKTAGIKPAVANSCILIWLDGGPTHLETFDPKPDAPSEVRGPFSTIPSNVAGIRLSECMSETAQVMDEVAIIRSVTSPLGEHNFGTHYLMTGYPPSPALEYPMLGSTIASLRTAESELPANIAIPKFTSNISGNGFLPAAAKPFSVGGDPAKGIFRIPDLKFKHGMTLERVKRRNRFVEALEESADQTADRPDLQRAYRLLASAEASEAFELSSEPASLRQKYGMGNSIGQSCLLARRLVERGVPFVTVNDSGWDTHTNLQNLKSRFSNDRNAKLPSLDRAVAALIRDLRDREMLDQTLIVVMGEFGRTPKINARGGRDHWPKAFSVAMAGGGIRGGQVIGKSDGLGEFPKERPVTPPEIAATIFTQLGIDPDHEIKTKDGRPIRLVRDGAKAISELI